jgi:uncharacterized protein UPF0158
MKRKPIRIDWDDLVGAFDNSNEELAYYLDLVNGHVVLEGEGEEDAFDDDDDNFVPVSQAQGKTAPDNTRADIERLTHETKITWLEEFLQVEPPLDPPFAAALREALEEEDDPTEIVAEILAAHADGKDRWYRYRRERLQERIDGWLAEHQVAFIDPPPWR